ncbi:MAG: aminodeoxychorismate/anthranilate synthase component II [Candidatus Omnitrophota bacterium]|jgi:anthranilate synthase/aminodeoxychorismate synthase-like glutamine amidotransferase|nr:MAG: anthranilate/aminodeoxychorismate synthase component II [Omnitrophica bacterium GWA2_41_15]HAZ10945.1 anthranilate/aminodeoxychorismate synthase component II [Candidatus Omnitrophota bacterium]
MILMIDNYDSFTYNLVQYLSELGEKLTVYRNDKINIEEIKILKPNHIVISPGPGRPSEAGISEKVIKEFGARIPLLGVCLGHQAIGEVFGGKVIRADKLMHGKTSLIYHNANPIFKGLSNPFEATRYHSLIVEKKSFPDALQIMAWTKDNEIMGLAHKKFPIWGVQFHPESILTKEGKQLLKNFINL